MNDAVRLEAPRVGPEGYDAFWDAQDGRHFDRRGNKITFREWTMLWGLHEAYRIVKQEYVGDYWVSTVWLGLDHGFGGGAPLIFVTMVFNHSKAEPPPFPNTMDFESEEFKEWSENYPEQTSASDLDCERYATEEQALAGHQAMVEKVRLILAIEKSEQDAK